MSLISAENSHLNVNFRKDINVLRAFAVTAVILFHFDFDFALGGYLGVDVFFVISGYLMTAIILSRLTQKKFNLGSFYVSRLLRIVPALVMLCLVLGGLGWFLIFPFDYAYLAKNINHALTFKSNITFSRGTGYFDTGADLKWLLHTWSLSVEMQFYLIYPLLLILIYKIFGLIGVRVLLVAGFLASLGFYIWAMSREEANVAFYLLQSRAWQLLAGGLIVIFPVYNLTMEAQPGKLQQGLRSFGIVLILVSAALGVGNESFAAGWAILSTVGAVLILATSACLPHLAVPGLSLFKLIVHYVGQISYSLYLWHWPVRLIQKYTGYEESAGATFIAILATFLLSALSFHFIEKTANTYAKRRQANGFNWRPLVAMAATFIVLGGVYGSAKAVRENSGVVQRLESLPFENIPTYLFENPELYLLEGIADKCPNNAKPCYLTAGEKVKTPKWKPDLILSGDSHAMAIAHALSEVSFKDRNLNLLLSGSAACIFFRGYEHTLPIDKKFSRCKRAYENFQEMLDAVPVSVPLLLANNFPQYLKEKGRWSKVRYLDKKDGAEKDLSVGDAWLDMVCKITSSRKVFVMKSVPSTAVPVVKTLVQSVLNGTISDLNQAYFDKPIALHRKLTSAQDVLLNRAVRECGVTLIDPADILCEGNVCQGTTSDVIPLYRDGSHLSLFGSRKLIPLFERSFAGLE
ncbi:acyltransferase family protein [Sneathiella sp. P13V-1]|uniref:acyltransferase family protein n=1 Tax=Sneathiella sp. P13V-1 TaxID=2697366 RepID=UPI00187B3D67|nr:acyltransferase family protein [Sneathiella sp. P13V-1]MBE7635931.1 acyltransferase family protein [Sneathiella sp. P13V-1]